MSVASLDSPVGVEVEPSASFGTGLRARVRANGDDGPALATAAVSRLLFSPELALVDPDLRALALAELPTRDPDAFLPPRPVSSRQAIAPPRPVPPAALFDVSEGNPDAPRAARMPRRELALGVIAYTLRQTIGFAVEATTVVGGLVLLVMLIQLLHS
jgi:hypothetical protein